MASGYGLNGGVSRCFPFWQDLLSCYVVNTAGGDSNEKWKCIPQRDDYLECLHHRKEIDKTKAINAAYRRYEIAHAGFSKAETGGAAGAKTTVGGVKGLGLLAKDS
ncbi:hypothetical protein DFH27DRAFT_341077 [Peziza echinospora]|nr:hypothetical protein DFH27DRAFT_341077 [Peziza echinospora]